MATNPLEDIDALQTKLAFQEDLLASLNDALVNQQERISRLEAATRKLIETLHNMAPDDKPLEIDERPPHY